MRIVDQEFQMAYLAGWFEGEGSFMLCKKKRRPHLIPTAQGVSTDQDVAMHVAAVLVELGYAARVDGPYGGKGSSSPHWRVQMENWAAVEFMRAVRPRMRSRRIEQIDRCLNGSFAKEARRAS